jgi:hypothetical protein
VLLLDFFSAFCSRHGVHPNARAGLNLYDDLINKHGKGGHAPQTLDNSYRCLVGGNDLSGRICL